MSTASARRAAASACSFLAQEDEDSAQAVLAVYMLEEMVEHGSPILAMRELVSALMGVAVMVAPDQGAFDTLTLKLARTGGDW